MLRFLSLFFIFLISCLSGFSQLVFNHDDYPEKGDFFTTITYSAGQNNYLHVSNFLNSGWMFNSTNIFFDSQIDTVFFRDPDITDSLNEFPDATHNYKDQFSNIFIKKNSDKAASLGLKLQISDIFQAFQIKLQDPLTRMEFPFNSFSSFIDNSSVNVKQSAEEFKAYLPDSISANIPDYVDSIKFEISISNNSEVTAVDSVFLNLNTAIKGNSECLREKFTQNFEFNIYAKAGIFGWVPLSDIPNIEDILPLDLPYENTNYFIRLWSPEYGIPLVNMQTNESRDSVNSLTFIKNSGTPVNSTNTNKGIKLYPNPAVSKVFLEKNNDDIKYLKLFSQEGKKINSIPVNSNFFIFAVDNLSKGQYIMLFTDKNGNHICTKNLLIR